MLTNCVVLLYYTLFFGGCVCGVNGKTLIEKKKIIEIRKKHSRIYRLEFEKWKTLIFLVETTMQRNIQNYAIDSALKLDGFLN